MPPAPDHLPDPLLPVGRDCDCGHPLVWRRGEQVCAVFGSHPAPGQRIGFRSPGSAAGRRLIDSLLAADRHRGGRTLRAAS